MTARARIKGSALITALFLVIVLAALGAAMTSLSIVQQDTATKSVLSARVYYGAKAGLEWGIQAAIATNMCAASSGPFTLAGDAFQGVSITVTCVSSQHGGATLSTYYFTSFATTGTLGTLSYAERRMAATVSNIP